MTPTELADIKTRTIRRMKNAQQDRTKSNHADTLAIIAALEAAWAEIARLKKHSSVVTDSSWATELKMAQAEARGEYVP
jgi:ribonuclease HI